MSDNEQHSIKVRDAHLLDLLAMTKLAEVYADEAPQMKMHTIDVETLMRNMAATILDPKGYLTVLEVDGEVVGGMWGYLMSMPWSKVETAQDVILFVKKGDRGNGLLLIDSWVKWAESKGAKEIVLSTASGIKPKSFDKLMSRKGFTLQGYTYSKEVTYRQ